MSDCAKSLNRRKFLVFAGAATLGTLFGCRLTINGVPTDPTSEPQKEILEWTSHTDKVAWNREDTVFLFDSSGTLVETHEYWLPPDPIDGFVVRGKIAGCFDGSVEQT